MKLSEIQAIWDVDCRIDSSRLDEESTKTAILHAKYWRLFIDERMALKRMTGLLKQFELEKKQFYTEGPTPEQHAKGWKLPARGMILKSEVQPYLDADQELIDFNLKVAFQQEKVKFLEAVISALDKRSFHIRNCLEFTKWSQGL